MIRSGLAPGRGPEDTGKCSSCYAEAAGRPSHWQHLRLDYGGHGCGPPRRGCMIMIVTGHGFKISCLSSSHWRLSEFSVAINFSQAARSVVKLQKARPPPFIHLMHGHTRFSGFGPAAGTVSLLSCATGNCFRDSEAAEC